MSVVLVIIILGAVYYTIEPNIFLFVCYDIHFIKELQSTDDNHEQTNKTGRSRNQHPGSQWQSVTLTQFPKFEDTVVTANFRLQ